MVGSISREKPSFFERMLNICIVHTCL